jgi:hypothetical protein
MRQFRGLRFHHVMVCLVLGLGCLVLVRTFSRPRIRYDGIGYYAPLASLVFDHDLDLRNEVSYAHPFFRKNYFVRPDGTAVDPYPVGAAVLWSPVLLVAHALDRDPSTIRRPGSIRSSPAFEPRYLRAIAIATGLEALLACGLLVVALRRLTGRLPALLGTMGCALGTPLLFYALAEPSYSHTASFLVGSALVASVLADRNRHLPLPWLGFLWGLATLVRWQDALLGLLLAPRLVEELRQVRVRPRQTLGGLLLFGSTAVLVFSPQVMFWQVVYGHPLVFTPPGGFMRWGHPQVLPMLFSTWHGAFVWSPLLLVGFVGLSLLRDRGLRWSMLCTVALEIYACAAASDWWGSGGFGPRRLTAVAPLAGLGLALLVQRAMQIPSVSRARLATAACAGAIVLGSLWTMRLAQYNLAGMLPYNPERAQDYNRGYPAGDPRLRPYALWDHARLVREIVDAERFLWQRHDHR